MPRRIWRATWPGPSWSPPPRLSTRNWVLGGLLVSAVTTGVMGLARTLAMFLILRAAGGVASAIVLVLTCAAVLETLAALNRSELAALLFAGVGAGIVGSALLVSALRAVGLGWSALWIGSGAMSLLGVWACWHLIPAEIPARSPAKTMPKVPLGHRFTRLTAAYGLFGFGYIMTATFLVAIVRSRASTRVIEPIVWIIFGGAAVPSVALWSAAGRRIGIPRVFALAALTEAFGVLATVSWRSVVGISVGGALIGGTFMGLTALGLMRGRELAARNPQRGVALLTSAFGLGQIVGPSFAGALSDRLGNFTVPSVIATAALITSAALVAG